jgi:hypothetical protein
VEHSRLLGLRPWTVPPRWSWRGAWLARALFVPGGFCVDAGRLVDFVRCVFADFEAGSLDGFATGDLADLMVCVFMDLLAVGLGDLVRGGFVGFDTADFLVDGMAGFVVEDLTGFVVEDLAGFVMDGLTGFVAGGFAGFVVVLVGLTGFVVDGFAGPMDVLVGFGFGVFVTGDLAGFVGRCLGVVAVGTFAVLVVCGLSGFVVCGLDVFVVCTFAGLVVCFVTAFARARGVSRVSAIDICETTLLAATPERSIELRTSSAGPSAIGAASTSAIIPAPASMVSGFVKCMLKLKKAVHRLALGRVDWVMVLDFPTGKVEKCGRMDMANKQRLSDTSMVKINRGKRRTRLRRRTKLASRTTSQRRAKFKKGNGDGIGGVEHIFYTRSQQRHVVHQ